MEKENTFLNADNLYEEVEGEAGKELALEIAQKTSLIGIVKSRFNIAEDARRSDESRWFRAYEKDRFQQAQDARKTDETRWLKAYENYRGLYNKSVKFRDSEKSRIFVKITKTKVLAAFGQLVDVIFGTGKFPIGIAETGIPEGELGYSLSLFIFK